MTYQLVSKTARLVTTGVFASLLITERIWVTIFYLGAVDTSGVTYRQARLIRAIGLDLLEMAEGMLEGNPNES